MDCKTYEMLPIKRPEGAIPVSRPGRKPVLAPNAVKKYFRIVKLSENGKIASITASMQGEMLTVTDVDVSSLGYKSVEVGDILAYQPHDLRFEKPVITHRWHQQHQHPEILVAPDEK